MNNCVFLENVGKATSSSSTSYSNGGAIRVSNGDLSVLDSTFKKNSAFQVNPSPSAVGGGGAIYMESGPSCANGICKLLVAGSVFELNEASNEGGAVFIKQVGSGEATLKVGWINNNAFLFDNTAGETCEDVFVSNTIDTTTKCVSVGDNVSV